MSVMEPVSRLPGLKVDILQQGRLPVESSVMIQNSSRPSKNPQSSTVTSLKSVRVSTMLPPRSVSSTVELCSGPITTAAYTSPTTADRMEPFMEGLPSTTPVLRSTMRRREPFHTAMPLPVTLKREFLSTPTFHLNFPSDETQCSEPASI